MGYIEIGLFQVQQWRQLGGPMWYFKEIQNLHFEFLYFLHLHHDYEPWNTKLSEWDNSAIIIHAILLSWSQLSVGNSTVIEIYFKLYDK